jgi:hypothetical protein
MSTVACFVSHGCGLEHLVQAFPSIGLLLVKKNLHCDVFFLALST